jgi:uncharacterized membrane protein
VLDADQVDGVFQVSCHRLKGGRIRSIFGVPTSLLATALYICLLTSLASHHWAIATGLAAAACATSAYLGFVMTTKIHHLCTTCINSAARNVLLLITQLW